MNNLFKKVVSGVLVAATAFTMLTPATGLFGTTTANAAEVKDHNVTYSSGDTSAALVDLTLGLSASTTYTLVGVTGTAASATLYAKVANDNVASATVEAFAKNGATVTVNAQNTVGNTTIDVYAQTVDKDDKTSAGASKILTINVTVNDKKTFDNIKSDVYVRKNDDPVSIIDDKSKHSGLKEINGSWSPNAAYCLYGEAADGSSSALTMYDAKPSTFTVGATQSAATYTVKANSKTSVGTYPITLYAAASKTVDKNTKEASKSINVHVIDLKVTDATKTNAENGITVDTKTGTDQLTISGESAKDFTYDYSLRPNSINTGDRKNSFISVDSTGKITALKATSAKQTVYVHVFKGYDELYTMHVDVTVASLPADTITMTDKNGNALGDVSGSVMKYAEFIKENGLDGSKDSSIAAYASYLDANKVGYIVLDAKQVKSNKITATGKSGAAITFSDGSEDSYGKALTINSSTGDIKVTADSDNFKGEKYSVNYVKVSEAEKASTTRATDAYVYVFVSKTPLASLNLEATSYTIAEGQKLTIGTQSTTNANDITYIYADLDTYPTDDDTAVMISDASSATTAVLTGVKAGKTVHVEVNTKGDTSVKAGYNKQIITVNVIPKADAQISSITNENTGKTVTDKLTIDSTTTLKLAIPSTSASIKVDGAEVANGAETIVQQVVDQDADTVKLIPNKEGTTTIIIYTNKYDNNTYSDKKVITVTYKKVSVKKVTGVKVTNKKGAKVTVKWNKVKKAAGYTVRYKAGSGAWKTKTISSNKKTTTLKVKKGATIRVKVRAYKTRSDGKKVYGKYSTLKKLTTDNK